jgi:hypothetical protein
MASKNVRAKNPPSDGRRGPAGHFGHSLFRKSLDAAVSKPRIFLYTLLLDIGFIGVFLLINYLANLFIPSDPMFITNAQKDTALFIGIILLVILYFLIVVLAYSFFSLVILGNIKSYSVNHKHDFSMFMGMFLLNLILFGIFFILLILFNLVLGLLANTSAWIATFFSIISVIVLFVAYVFHNFVHSAFIMNHELVDNLRHGLKGIFTRKYLGIMLFSLSVLLAYALIYFLIGIVFRDFILLHYEEFVNISSIFTIILIYAIFAFNRIYFFFIAEKHIGHVRK